MLKGIDTQVNRGVFPTTVTDGVVEHSKPCQVKERRVMVVCGVSGSVKFLVHNNSAANLRRALMERVYHVEVNGQLQRPPQPVPGIFEATLSALRERIACGLGRRTPIARTDFVLSRPAAKRRVYENALASLSLLPVSERDARIDGAFVKCEKINAKKGDPAPRIIQPRSVRYNIEVGRYLVAIEHDVYTEIDKLWGGVTVMKGYNAEEIGTHISEAWGQFTDPVALGLDASRFDQHVSAEALAFEHKLYNDAFRSPELRKLLSWQINNKGVAHADDATFVYKKRGSRMSGDMNTALGNIILMCLMVRFFVDQRGVKARLINNGDDCTLVFERADIERVLDGLREWFLNYGFNIVQEPLANCIEEIEFCQMHPVCVDGRWVMVRNVLASLSKDSISLRSRSLLELRQWMWCVGRCGLAMASGVPVQQAYYGVFCRSGVSGKRLSQVAGRCGLTWYSAGMAAEHREVAPSTRVSFWKAFGISPYLQECLEAEYERMALPPNATQAEELYVYMHIE